MFFPYINGEVLTGLELELGLELALSRSLLSDFPDISDLRFSRSDFPETSDLPRDLPTVDREELFELTKLTGVARGELGLEELSSRCSDVGVPEFLELSDLAALWRTAFRCKSSCLRVLSSAPTGGTRWVGT